MANSFVLFRTVIQLIDAELFQDLISKMVRGGQVGSCILLSLISPCHLGSNVGNHIFDTCVRSTQAISNPHIRWLVEELIYPVAIFISIHIVTLMHYLFDSLLSDPRN